MAVTTFTYPSNYDHVTIHAYKWKGKDDRKIKGVVQIAHGMVEHMMRYNEFAQFLTDNGYAVYGNDHRGHGKTMKSEEEYGFFAKENGFEKAVDDVRQLTEIIHEDHRDLPIFLFGHSMGSFLVRRYIQQGGSKLSGVILSGTAGDPGVLGKIGIFLARREMKRKGKRTPSPFLNKLVFGPYNKMFQPERTPFDWLTSNSEVVDEYINDPLCGGVCTTSFYYDLFTGLLHIHDDKNIERTPKDLPIFIFSGDKDPVGGKNGKGVLQVYEKYKALGLKDITCKLYKDGRHEMLNERNKEEVYGDILQWLNERT